MKRAYPFSGTEPKAQAKTQLTRTQSQKAFTTFVSTGFPAATTTQTACIWGADEDEEDPAVALMNAKPGTNVNVISEELGEAGAVFTLQDLLRKQGLEYDDDNLHVFNGANTFNMVYFDKTVSLATRAVIIEAKGGNSGLGTRQDPLTGATVKQGTPEYVDVIVNILAGHKNAKKQNVGQKLKALIANGQGDVLYVGVQTKYDKNKQIVYDPVFIFSEKM